MVTDPIEVDQLTAQLEAENSKSAEDFERNKAEFERLTAELKKAEEQIADLISVRVLKSFIFHYAFLQYLKF